VNYAATFLGGNKKYPLSSNAPPLSKQQLHAMKALQEAAREVCVRLTPKAGDMLFMNNYGLMHARDMFVDSVTDQQKKRYIMRLWLHDDHKGWESASALKRNLDQNFDLPPEKQGLMTGNEWDKLPRSWRVKDMGVSGNDCHD
jgi:Taurine catabolism dioxygenase TauD, TfdA family